MTFIDEINIYVSSGKGGDGSNSFFKKKNTKYKIPDGGNGGDGGDVYIKGNKSYLTFLKIKSNKTYKAEDGNNGKKNKKNGKNGKNLIIEVPIGTVIYDKEKKIYIGEIKNEEQKILITKGGKKGFGNYYQNNKNKIQFGEKQKIKLIHLELFIIAQVGLLGFPNVGKSSLINKITNKKAKVENYNFTTLYPNIGTLKGKLKKNILIADIPGLIKSSHKGKGLGINFLKHLTKNKLLLHIIEIENENIYKVIKNTLILENELKSFDQIFAKKKKWIIINKIDLKHIYNKNYIKTFMKMKYELTFFISAKHNLGIKKLIFNLKEYFNKYE